MAETVLITCRSEDLPQARAIASALKISVLDRHAANLEDPEERERLALADLRDITQCETLIVLGNPPYIQDDYMERDLHAGIAIALKKRVIFLGPKAPSNFWFITQWIKCHYENYFDKIKELTAS